MKKILAILCATLVLSVILTGCVKQEESSEETINDIEKETDEITQLEQELDDSDIADFEKDLEELDNW